MALTEQNNIACAWIAFYTVALAVGILLNIRHGFNRSAGWLYLIIFSLMRIVGGALQLAATVNGTNANLLIGASVLVNSGIAPLILIQVALLVRVLNSIRKSKDTIVQPNHLRLLQLIILIGLILTAVGGSNSGTTYAETGVYTISNLSQAGLGLILAGYALVVLMAVACGMDISHAEPGEKRLALAVALSLPFIFVRILYPCVSVFGNNMNFSSFGGDVNIELGMAVIMEMIVVAIVESIGVTVKTLPKEARGQNAQELKNYSRRDRTAQYV